MMQKLVFKSDIKLFLFIGALNIPKCTGSWLNGVNIFRIGQQAIFKVALRDDVGRPLIYRSYWNLLVYVMDFRGKRRMRPTLMDLGQSGYIGVSFNTTLIGNFWLRIGDDSSQIKNSPFLFSVLPGLCANLDSSIYLPFIKEILCSI